MAVLIGAPLTHLPGATVGRKRISKNGCHWKRDLWFDPTMDYQGFQNCGPRSTGEVEEETEEGCLVSTDSVRGGNGVRKSVTIAGLME